MICQEPTLLDEPCGGIITVEADEDWLTYRCDRCGIERVRSARSGSQDQRRALRLEQAQIPDRFLGCRFDTTPDNEVAVTGVHDWIDKYDGTPLPAPALWGLAGRGKSHLLAAACTRLIRTRDVTGMFCTARGLLRDLQDFNGAADRTWQRAVTVDVLALDDLGAQQGTDWRHDQLADLIDSRYQARLPILIATNYPPSQWPAVLDARTASRLTGMTFPLELRGGDRRQVTLETGAAA